jgi:hypothetical protein
VGDQPVYRPLGYGREREHGFKSAQPVEVDTGIKFGDETEKEFFKRLERETGGETVLHIRYQTTDLYRLNGEDEVLPTIAPTIIFGSVRHVWGYPAHRPRDYDSPT